MGPKYERLREHLMAAARRGDESVEFAFAEIDDFVRGLPRSARAHRAWWANGGHVQAEAWLSAGWRVDSVSLDREHVRLLRDPNSPLANAPAIPLASARREEFLRQVLAATRDFGRFDPAHPSRVVVRRFRGHRFLVRLPKSLDLCIEACIEESSSEHSQLVFERLRAQRAIIEAELGFALGWRGTDGRRRCTIQAVYPGSPLDLDDDIGIDVGVTWASTQVLNLYQSLQGRIAMAVSYGTPLTTRAERQLTVQDASAEDTTPSGDAAEYRRLVRQVEQREADTHGQRTDHVVHDPIRLQSARQAVLLRSNDRCENPGCGGQPADVTDDGRPILEVDHVSRLADGGHDHPLNMIALCPNCHAMKERGKNRDTLQKTLMAVAEYEHERWMRRNRATVA